jgi:hypothetical protein
MTRYTKQQEPELFDLIWDEDRETSFEDHRKGSSFYVQWVFDLTSQSIPEKYRGFWETNQFIWSDLDYDKDDIRELTKVEKVEEIKKTYAWKETE